MTMCETFSTWREAYDYAREELESPEYRCWGWGRVYKDDRDGRWVAEIA